MKMNNHGLQFRMFLFFFKFFFLGYFSKFFSYQLKNIYTSLASPALAGIFSTVVASGKPGGRVGGRVSIAGGGVKKSLLNLCGTQTSAGGNVGQSRSLDSFPVQMEREAFLGRRIVGGSSPPLRRSPSPCGHFLTALPRTPSFPLLLSPELAERSCPMKYS